MRWMTRPHLTLYYTTLQRKSRCELRVVLAQFSSAARPWRTAKPVCLRLLRKHGPDSGIQKSGAHGANGDQVFTAQAPRYPKADRWPSGHVKIEVEAEDRGES